MKKNQLKELRKKDTKEAKKQILKLQILIRKIKFGGQHKEKNVKKIKTTKKEVARILTVINEKK